MFKPLLFALALTVPALTVAAQPQQQGQTLAAQYAAGMQGLVGQKFEGDIGVQGVAAEANTLVITVDGPQGWSSDLSPDEISGALIGGFCGEAPEFFKSGVTMRVDSLDGGVKRKGPVVGTCPAAPAKE